MVEIVVDNLDGVGRGALFDRGYIIQVDDFRISQLQPHTRSLQRIGYGPVPNRSRRLKNSETFADIFMKFFSKGGRGFSRIVFGQSFKDENEGFFLPFPADIIFPVMNSG